MIRFLTNRLLSPSAQFIKCATPRLYCNKPATVDKEKSNHQCSDGDEDELQQKSKTFPWTNSRTPSEVIASLPSNPNELSLVVHNVFKTLEKMPNLKKTDIQHPNFQVLRDGTKQAIPRLTQYQLKDMAVTIINHDHLRNDKINKYIMDALIPRLPKLSFKSIVILDYLIQKKRLEKFYEILRLNIRIIFLFRVDELLDGFEEFESLKGITIYMSNNTDIVSRKMLNRLATSLLLAEENLFDMKLIESIIIMLSRFDELDEHVIKLLNKMTQLYSKCTPTITNVRLLISLIRSNSKTIDKKAFIDSGLIPHFLQTLSESDTNISVSVFGLIDLIDMGFGQEIIQTLSERFEDDSSNQKLHQYMCLCISCERMCCKPMNWDSKILPALKAFNFREHINTESKLTWFRFAVTMNSLGYCDIDLIGALLNSPNSKNSPYFNALREIYTKECPDKMQEIDKDLSSNEKLETSIHDSLRDIIGAEKIWIDHRLDDQLSIPFVLKIDLRTEDLLHINEAPTFGSVKINEMLIGIIVVNSDKQWEKLKRFIIKQLPRVDRPKLGLIKVMPHEWFSLTKCQRASKFYEMISAITRYRKFKENTQI